MNVIKNTSPKLGAEKSRGIGLYQKELNDTSREKDDHNKEKNGPKPTVYL